MSIPRLPAIAFLIMAAIGTNAAADGMMIAPWQYDIYETDQVAFLDFDANSGVERLHILPEFQSNTQDFAWIVPVPSLPELDESEAGIFRDLAALTAPEYRYRDEGWGCSQVDYMTAPADGNGGVEIIEEELVGIYRTMIVGADDAGLLTDSLTVWGFLHDDNTDEIAAMLETYVDEGWFFVTLKVDSTAFAEDPQDWYWYGAMYPIKLTFAVDAPVYPMRISALSADDDTAVTLYIKSDRRMDFEGAETHYANRFTDGELRAIRVRYPHLSPLLAEGEFITKLLRRYSPEQMDADLYPEPAGTNAEYRRIQYSGLPLTSGLMLAMLGLVLIRSRRSR